MGRSCRGSCLGFLLLVSSFSPFLLGRRRRRAFGRATICPRTAMVVRSFPIISSQKAQSRNAG